MGFLLLIKRRGITAFTARQKASTRHGHTRRAATTWRNQDWLVARVAKEAKANG
jgi:hypothetical protein